MEGDMKSVRPWKGVASEKLRIHPIELVDTSVLTQPKVDSSLPMCSDCSAEQRFAALA